MKNPSKKTNPNGRRTLDIPMGKSNAPQTNRREQKRECEKRYEKQRKNINTDEKMKQLNNVEFSRHPNVKDEKIWQ